MKEQNQSNIVSFEFKYIDFEDEYIIIPEDAMDNCEERFPGKRIISGVLQVKKPLWTDVYEIERKSKGYSRKISPDNPFGKKKLVFFPDKIKYWKIKTLCHAIIMHDEVVSSITQELVENLDISFAQFILGKIDAVVSKENLDGLPKEDGDDLAMDCYNYFSKLKKSSRDPYLQVPEPPAVVIMMKLAKSLGLTFDQIRSMSKKDIDEIFIARGQENLCENPAVLGQGRKIAVDPKMLKKTEGSLMEEKRKKKLQEKQMEHFNKQVPVSDQKAIPRLYDNKNS